MNTNVLHNALNVAMALVAALSLPEVSGLFPPDVAVKIVGAMATLKLVINTLRDGLAGLLKAQPPVQ